MPNWNQVFSEMVAQVQSGDGQAIDTIRRKYLAELYQYTGRNIIAYYSGWLQKSGYAGVEITDEDKNGFMMAIHGMDCKKGLDLIIHTPGGGIAATESIIDYLHRKFRDTDNKIDIRVIVPQLAMSAGTMIACSGCRILLGRQSSLGPIDPHLANIPAHGVIDEFRRAYDEISKDPKKLAVWQFILQKYQPTFLSQCENAIKLSEEFVLENLQKVMFAEEPGGKKKAQEIVKYLTAYKDRKEHNRHINIDECKKIGLRIEDLENDQRLQDLVLTVHHCYMHSLSNTAAFKIIENHDGQVMFKMININSA